MISTSREHDCDAVRGEMTNNEKIVRDIKSLNNFWDFIISRFNAFYFTEDWRETDHINILLASAQKILAII